MTGDDVIEYRLPRWRLWGFRAVGAAMTLAGAYLALGPRKPFGLLFVAVGVFAAVVDGVVAPFVRLGPEGIEFRGRRERGEVRWAELEALGAKGVGRGASVEFRLAGGREVTLEELWRFGAEAAAVADEAARLAQLCTGRRIDRLPNEADELRAAREEIGVLWAVLLIPLAAVLAIDVLLLVNGGWPSAVQALRAPSSARLNLGFLAFLLLQLLTGRGVILSKYSDRILFTRDEDPVAFRMLLGLEAGGYLLLWLAFLIRSR